MTRRQQALVMLGLLISIVFLWFAFRDLRPGDVINELQDVNVVWLLVAAAVYFIAVAIITVRWQFLLRAVKFIPLGRLFPLVCIGYMGNNVYPFRSGEALRIFLLNRNERVPVIKATTTVLVERVFDGIVMLTFIVVPLSFVEVASNEMQRVATFAAPIFLAALAVFFVLAAQPNLLRALVKQIKRLLPGKLEAIVDKISEEVISGLEGLRSPAHLAGTVLSSYTTWAVEAGVYWIVSWAFDLGTSYAVMLLVVGTVNLAGLIPASPGQIGVFEFFVSAVLVGVGISETNALTYAIVVHIVIWLPVTLAGFAFLARQGLGWQSITRAREMEEKAVIG
ncbi:MAG: lysylphosphatidylglycerol synthase transmembrane domain-containing protein [Anaerolineae bacterium]